MAAAGLMHAAPVAAAFVGTATSSSETPHPAVRSSGLRRPAPLASQHRRHSGLGWTQLPAGRQTRRAGRQASRGKPALAAVAAVAGEHVTLNDLPLISYVNMQGMILPPVEPGTQATVFAIFDQTKKIQYIGFSKDIRNSLRLLFGRRPEFCYYYKLAHLPVLDQTVMLAIRNQWMSEVGLPPPGNADQTQRNFWEKPSEAGSISERGKVAAATSKAKTFLQFFMDRGLKEEMVYDPALLEKGLCDVLPAKELSEEELAAAAVATAAQSWYGVKVEGPKGVVVEYEMLIESKVVTNGGCFFDMRVRKDDKETKHRIICGKIYPEACGLTEEVFVERILAFMMAKGVPRQTEGLLSNTQFPINYFSVSEVAQWWAEVKDWFPGELPDAYWRFNRIHEYGAAADPPPLVGPVVDLRPVTQKLESFRV